MRITSYLITSFLFVLLLASISDSRRGKGTRRRGKMRKQGSPRFLFYTNPRRMQYYDNPNVVLSKEVDAEPDILGFDTLPDSKKHKYYSIRNQHLNSKAKILPLTSNNDLLAEKESLIDSTLPLEKPKIGPNLPMPSKNFQLPFEALIKLEFNNKIREVFINVRPMMSVLEALKQAEIKFQKKMKFPYDEELITFWPSSEFGCIIVDKISTIYSNKSMIWKLMVTNFDGEIEYNNICVPPKEDLFIKPGSIINLSYVNVDIMNT